MSNGILVKSLLIFIYEFYKLFIYKLNWYK